MVIFNMYSNNKKQLNTVERIGCRGFLIDGDNILLIYEANTDTWMSPGGGVEYGETFLECCAREFLEETGLVIAPRDQIVTIKEHFDDITYINHYFYVEYVRESYSSPTIEEQQNGIKAKWIPISLAKEIFGKYEEYKDIDVMKSGLYKRENIALSYFDTARKHGAIR